MNTNHGLSNAAMSSAQKPHHGASTQSTTTNIVVAVIPASQSKKHNRMQQQPSKQQQHNQIMTAIGASQLPMSIVASTRQTPVASGVRLMMNNSQTGFNSVRVVSQNSDANNQGVVTARSSTGMNIPGTVGKVGTTTTAVTSKTPHQKAALRTNMAAAAAAKRIQLDLEQLKLPNKSRKALSPCTQIQKHPVQQQHS